MAAKQVIFLGSKPVGYHCLKTLIAQAGILDVVITGVLTNARKEFGGENDLAALAVQNDIPVYSQPEDIPECDLMYSVQYHKILSAEVIARAKLSAVNLHMAPLPEYRGSNQFSFALLDAKHEFGVTIHLMDHRIDHGDILFQRRFPIPDNCWVDHLYQLTYHNALKLFSHTLGHIVSGNYTPVPQAALLHKYGTSLHLKKEMEALKVIDLNWDAEKIARQIRATSMPGFEPPYCVINGEKVFFTRSNA